jgi:hypothetical protein
MKASINPKNTPSACGSIDIIHNKFTSLRLELLESSEFHCIFKESMRFINKFHTAKFFQSVCVSVLIAPWLHK